MYCWLVVASRCWNSGKLVNGWWWTKSTVTFQAMFCRRIRHNNTFQTQTFATRHNLSATGFSSATGTRLCHMSYCTRRLRTLSCDWTTPHSTNCVTPVNAWHNTMLVWQTSFVMSGEIFCSKWLATVQTTHNEVIQVIIMQRKARRRRRVTH